MTRTSVSVKPRMAPQNFRDLPAKVVISDGDGLWETWHGAGIASSVACHACGNSDGNLQIYGNVGTSYPNGNSWDDAEILCAGCGSFTLINVFIEG